MEKNLHNIDDIFKQAHQNFDEKPSADVWDKLESALDKKDAEKYRRRFIGWKRAAILLFLLFLGLALYEIVFVKQNTGKFNTAKTEREGAINSGNDKKTSTANETPIKDGYNNINKNNISDTLAESSSNSARIEWLENNEDSSDKKTILNNKEQLVDKYVQQENKQLVDVEKNVKVNNIQLRNESTKADQWRNTSYANNDLFSVNKKGKPVAKKQPVKQEGIVANRKERPIFPATTDKVLKNEIALNNTSSISLVNILEKIKTEGTRMFDFQHPLLIHSDSLLKNIIADNKKNNPFFEPYWAVTAFATNERAQFRQGDDEINKREKTEEAYFTGIYVTRQLSNRWGIKSGLQFSHTAISIDEQPIYASHSPWGNIAYKYITSMGNGYINPKFGLTPAIGDSILATEAEVDLFSMGIPLMASYTMSRNKFFMTASAGLLGNFNTKSKIKTEVTDMLNREVETIHGLDGMRKFYTSLIADVNLGYDINNKLSINLLPSFRYAITPINQGSTFKTYPYRYGLGAGLTYKF